MRLEKTMMRNAVKLQISEATDVAYAALDAKCFARDLGFSIADQYTIATTVSELAQNIVKYADFGYLSFKTIQQGSDVGIEVLAKDSGNFESDPNGDNYDEDCSFTFKRFQFKGQKECVANQVVSIISIDEIIRFILKGGVAAKLTGLLQSQAFRARAWTSATRTIV